MTPLKVLLVAPPDSPLVDRVARWGGRAELVSLDFWLGSPSPSSDLVVFDLTGEACHRAERVGHELTRAGLTAVWVVDGDFPAAGDAAGKGAEPLLFWKDSPDSLGAWTLRLGESLRSQRLEWHGARGEARAFQDLAGGLSIGLFRFRFSRGQNITLEYFSHRAEVLTGLSFSELAATPELLYERLLPEDRGPLRTLLESLRVTPRTDEVKVRMKIGPKLRTLRLRFDVPSPGNEGFLYQGMIEDVTEDVRRSQYGDRALELLWQIKENLNLLDLVEPQFGGGALLSPREGEVYQLLRVGLSNALIASRLGCKESTVKKHVSAIFDKKGVNSRAQLLSLDQ